MAEKVSLTEALQEVAATAIGQDHRDDPVLPRSGGPAGNARLTAWTGVLLLALFVAELVTLLDVRGLISWHLALGVLLLPPALLKTGSTGWRIVRYYLGDTSYRSAGPPPLLLRLLGPLVILGTLALLGTGLTLVLVGEPQSRLDAVTVVGQRVDLITLHQAAFAVWCVATGLHVLARLVPAWQLTRSSRRRLPGRAWRAVALLTAAAAGVVCVGWVLVDSGGWRDQRDDRPFRDVGIHRHA